MINPVRFQAAVEYLRRTLAAEQKEALYRAVCRGGSPHLFHFAEAVVCHHLRRGGFDEVSLGVGSLRDVWRRLVEEALAPYRTLSWDRDVDADAG